MRNAVIISMIAACQYLACGEELGEALKKSKIYGYAKAMYVFDDRKGVKLDQSTLGFGGKAGVETGSFLDTKLKAAYYLTTDFGTRSKDPKEVDAYMFDVDKRPYSVLGEFNMEYKNGNDRLVLGRQELDTPMVSTYEYRIIPNLFEAYSYYTAPYDGYEALFSYIAKMSGLDGLVSFKDFESMSQQTYSSLIIDEYGNLDTSGNTVDISRISGHQGVFMTGVIADKSPRAQLWNYYCKDTVNQAYADIAYKHGLSQNSHLLFEAQIYAIEALGKFKEYLGQKGLNLSYGVYGAKLSYEDKNIGITPYIAFNKFTGGEKTVTVFGNWGGYPEYVAIPYMFSQDNAASTLAGSKMAKVGLKLDLGVFGVGAQTINLGYSYIDINDKIIKESDTKILNFIYRAAMKKNIKISVIYDNRSSKNYRNDNDTLTLSSTYIF